MNEPTSASQAPLLWRKSRSCNPLECVEVAFTEDRVLVRDSKDQHGPILDFSITAWHSFLTAVTQGSFKTTD